MYFLCNCRSIRVAIAILEAAADYVVNTKRIVFVPFMSFVVIIITMIFWILGMLCVFSVGTITGSDDGSQFKEIKWDENTRRLVWF